MKKLLFPSLILFLLSSSCTNTTPPVATETVTFSDTTKIDTSDFEAANPNNDYIEGEDDEDRLSFKDSVTIEYGDYHITQIPYSIEMGSELRILNKKTGKLMFAQAKQTIQSYEGDYLVTSGTTGHTLNSVSIIKLSDASFVFGSDYSGEMELKNGVITFKAPVEQAVIPKLPTCSKEVLAHPQNIGYLELQKYDINALKHIKTGIFECYVYE
ncbi:MAG: hypothetical protein CFE21_04315 [Bacteroidetes bacterium B1(2017)]|nr:MAG: hypothetical protein CFE21_04315 [Bacteroidetes bacterium B1(2017)]